MDFLYQTDTWIVFGVFLFAGFAKGIVGLGLPSISLGLLTTLIGLPSAMALMVVPSFATNAWQGISGPGTGALLRRMAPLLISAVAAIFAGVWVLSAVEARWMSSLLGVLILTYGIAGLTTPALPKIGNKEGWLGPLAGGLNGLLTGMTGSSVVPGVFYMQALGLARDQFVKAIGLLFTISAVGLFVALWWRGRMGIELGAISVIACIPAFVGMSIGSRVRHALSEKTFRKVFFWALIALGGYIFIRAVTG